MAMRAPDHTKPSDLHDALGRHFKNNPGSLLRAEMASTVIEEMLKRFEEADRIALAKQRSYRRFGRFALVMMLVGSLIGSVALLPLSLDGWVRGVLDALQGLAMISFCVAVVWIWLRKPAGYWMERRAEAERIRADIFAALVEVGASKGLLRPALDCFSDAHLRWQHAFYKRRGPEHEKAAGHMTPVRILGYLMLVTALVLGFSGAVKTFAEWGFSWQPLTTAVGSIPLERPGSWQLGIGAMASSILAFASARSYMDQDERNAACYRLAAEQLDELERNDLPKAQAAADAGDSLEVRSFCANVQAVLSAEHDAWKYTPRPVIPTVKRDV